MCSGLPAPAAAPELGLSPCPAARAPQPLPGSPQSHSPLVNYLPEPPSLIHGVTGHRLSPETVQQLICPLPALTAASGSSPAVPVPVPVRCPTAWGLETPLCLITSLSQETTGSPEALPAPE